jgi:DNA polymerase-3 subunit epsilon
MFDFDLDRPLAVFDLETTGTNPQADRIIDLAVVRIHPNRTEDTHAWRLNPGIPIPADSTRIHGISDADVAKAPVFAAVADEVFGVFEGCDLAGYNIIRFDVPLLAEEFARIGMTFSVEGRRILDAQRIFHRREPRDLSAALAFYCGEMHVDAHGAEADARATMRVLQGEFRRYPDLPRNMKDLDAYCNPRPPEWVDRTGKLKWIGGDIVLNFGKSKGTTLRHFIDNDRGFIKWMLRSGFPPDTKQIVEDALQGRWPNPPREDPRTDATGPL